MADFASNTVARVERLQARALQARDAIQGQLPLEKLLPPDEDARRSRFPRLLARVPLFAPVRNRADHDTDFINGETIRTPWGEVRRIGPGVDIYDEDTLIALIKIGRQRQIEGRREDLPVPMTHPGIERGSNADRLCVHVGKVNAYAINKYLGRNLGGADLAACRRSIRRLSLVSVFLLSAQKGTEVKLNLFDYAGATAFDGDIFIQFHPWVVNLLAEYTLIDMDIRRELSPLGKSAHKFLSSQLSRASPAYQIQLNKLKLAVGYRGAIKDFSRSLQGQLTLMQRLGWLDAFEVAGTGRRTPLKLLVEKHYH